MDIQSERMRSALLWAIDRLAADGGMTAQEQKDTADQIGRVLRGLPSRAATYVPDDWQTSAKLNRPQTARLVRLP